MNNRENMKNVIKNDFDKENNYKKIACRMNEKKIVINYKYAFIPMILIITISIILFNKQSVNKVRTFKDDSKVNNFVNQNNNDYEGLNINISSSANIIVNELKDFKLKNYDSINYINNINIPYFEILKDIKIPYDFDISADGKGVCISKDKKDKDYGKINNYELWYKNSKNNRKIIIALSDRNIPYRDFMIDRKNSNKTIINGVEVEIYKHKNIYVSIFSYKGYNFDIESCDIIEEEYVGLLYSLIK